MTERQQEALSPEEPRVAPARAKPRSLGFVQSSGEVLLFALRAIGKIPVAVRTNPAEVLRQAGILVRMHLFVVLFLAGMLGAMIGICGSFLFESLGLDSYVAIMIAVPMVRGVVAIVVGWVFAAKAGCGMVAELGAMRIGEEIDALEVMGVPSIPYLVGTRLAANLLVMPFLYLAALGTHFFFAQLFFVRILGTVSSGGYEDILYLLQDPSDLLFSVAAGAVVGFIVTVISCYHGYTTQGGPVGVGRSTAKSMQVNLVLISLTVMAMVQAYYGGGLNVPVGT